MSESADEGHDQNPDSIGHIPDEGFTEESMPRIDFDQALWMVDFVYNQTVTHYAANGDSEENALRDAIRQAQANGEMVLTCDHVRISRMYKLGEGGNSNGS